MLFVILPVSFTVLNGVDASAHWVVNAWDTVGSYWSTARVFCEENFPQHMPGIDPCLAKHGPSIREVGPRATPACILPGCNGARYGACNSDPVVYVIGCIAYMNQRRVFFTFIHTMAFHLDTKTNSLVYLGKHYPLPSSIDPWVNLATNQFEVPFCAKVPRVIQYRGVIPYCHYDQWNHRVCDITTGTWYFYSSDWTDDQLLQKIEDWAKSKLECKNKS